MLCVRIFERLVLKTMLIVVCLVGCFAGSIFAKALYPHDFVMTKYSIAEGLSGESITALFQDSKGFVWIGTGDGLNCYDGYSFTVYRHKIGDKYSISGNYIKSIAEDTDGNLWIGTYAHGLNKWNRDTKRFSPVSELSFPEENICGLLFQNDSTLWIDTNKDLVHYNIKSKQSKVFNYQSDSFICQSDHKATMLFRSPQSLWIGTCNGIHRYNTENYLFDSITLSAQNTKSFEFCSVSDLLSLDENKILVSGSKGLFDLEENGGGYYKVRKLELPENKVGVVRCLLKDLRGGIWLGTATGLRFLDCEISKRGNLNYYNPDSYFNKSKNLITNEDVTCLLEDNSGLIWVGTKYNGLLKLDFKAKKFKTLSSVHTSFKSLAKCDVRSIYEDGNNCFWLGTAKQGINKVDLANGVIHSYSINSVESKQEMGMVLCLCKDHKGLFWIGTSNGVYNFDPLSGAFSEFSFPEYSSMNNWEQEKQINAIEEDLKGNIWFGTKFGLYRYNGDTIEGFFADTTSVQQVSNNEVNTLYGDKEGILWIGTSGGVNYVNVKQGGAFKINHFKNSNDSVMIINNSWILSITEDNENRIWFGTRIGAACFDKKNNTFKFYTQNDGLKNDLIKGIVCDGSEVWLSTNRGVSLIDSTSRLYNFDVKDGLPGYVYNRGAVAVSKSGDVLFGGTKGIAVLNRDSLHFNDYKPNVLLTSIELFHKGKKVKVFNSLQDTIKFKYKKSSMLKVKFAALEFSDPDKNQFQLYLEGFDDDWQTARSSNEEGFSDLPVGEYTLYVRGANSDYIWSDNPAVLHISVVPPIWMSKYAYAFYLIAIVFLIQFIINFRIRHYKVAYKAMQEKAVDKEMIEGQRELLSKINLNLTDSIHYAKRIQESVFPSERRIKQSLADSFVYYRPKDVVSGDFCWMHEVHGKLFIAAVDCTGHGVPGAFMSIIAYDLLKGIVASGVESSPEVILDLLSREVIKTFRKDESSVKSPDVISVNDAMDIALCVIDKEKRILSFAGAYNPLYLVRNNEVFEYKGDRFPIGYQSDGEMKYSKHEIKIESHDTFYIFSDGYADQFGGPDGKKFKYRRFRHLLLNIHKLPAEDQKTILHQKLEEWMGDYEQVDDIIVIGMKPILDLV